MEEIILYIYKKYGILLSNLEAEEFIEWFKLNKDKFVNEEIMDSEASAYLYHKYKGRILVVNAEDLSCMNYLLMLLKKETEGK